MVQSSLEFLINHNVGIIQTLFGVLFLLLIFLILRSFKEDTPTTVYVEKSKSKAARAETSQKAATASAAAKSEMPMEASPLDDLDNLEDLVGPDEKSNLTLDPSKPADASTAAAAGAGASAATAAVSPEQKAELDKALAEKEKVIADLKTEISNLQQKASAPNTPAADTSELEGKIKELSEKLSEYEIIEEDIANLSFYKNENAKLKDELEKLRAGGAVASAASPAPAAPPVTAAPSPAPVAEAPAPAAPVAEAAPAVEAAPDLSSINPGDIVSVQPEVTPEPAAQATPSAPDPAAIAEFEQAIQQKEALDKTMPSQPSNGSEIDADILKEFENVVQKEWGGGAKEEVPAPAPEPVATEPAPATVEAAPAEPAATMSDEIDTTKLLSEVEELAQTEVKEDNSAPENEEDSKQKLIAEFESFINKAQ